MGWWTDLRDTAESAAVIAGNYFVPGSSLLTSRLTSTGSQEQLNSSLGKLAQLGSGLAGSGVGSEYTGIPASGGYSALSDMFNGNVPGATTSPVTTGNVTETNLGTLQSPTATATPTAPVFGTNTVAQGTNLAPADYTAGANYGAPVAPGGTNIQASQGVGTSLALPGSSSVGLNAPSEGYFSGITPTGASSSSGFLNSLMTGDFGKAASAAGNWAVNNPIPAIYGAGSLYDMYAKNQMAKQQRALYDQNRADILNTYAPGSPEYNLLKQEMERKDAAAGRNSQYGTRANEFAANIAKYRTTALSNLASGQNTLYNASLGNQYGMFNTPLTLAALTATQKRG